MDEEFYNCPVCGHEDHADKFGKHCPACGTDLDELEAEMEQELPLPDDQTGKE
jgi:rubrerythrin